MKTLLRKYRVHMMKDETTQADAILIEMGKTLRGDDIRVSQLTRAELLAQCKTYVKDNFVKVIDFPVPPRCCVGGESMWVRVIEGDQNNGVGILSNAPLFCEFVKEGDHIEFAGGTDHLNPSFQEVK